MDSVLLTQIADQIALQIGGVKNIIWFITVVNAIFLALLSLFGYWIWDLNKKVGMAVSGPECEARNNSQFLNTETLRLEIKADAEKLAERFSQDLEKSGKQRDAAIAALGGQLSLFMNKVSDQHQANFEILVEALRDIKSADDR